MHVLQAASPSGKRPGKSNQMDAYAKFSYEIPSAGFEGNKAFEFDCVQPGHTFLWHYHGNALVVPGH